MNQKNTAGYAWQAFAAICLMSIMWTGIQWNCMNLYAAPVVDELGISRAQFMLVLSIPAVISAVVSFLAFGAIEQRFGLRRMMLLGGILNTLAFLSWALMDSPAMLYLGGALYGLGASITAFNSINAGVGRWFKRRMGSLVGVANALGSLAGIVFALVIAAVIAVLGWRYSFWICVALSAVSTVVCVLLYRGNPEQLGVSAMYETEEPTPGSGSDSPNAASRAGAGAPQGGRGPSGGLPASAQADGVPFREALRMPRLWLLMAGYFLLGTTTYALMSTLPLFAVDFGYADLQGQVVSASLVAAAVMVVPLGMVCDRFGTKWGLALASALLLAACMALRLPSLPFAAMLVLAVVVGGSYSACSVCVGVGVRETFGDVDFGKKLGLCSGCLYIGLAVGPASANLAFDLSGSYALPLGIFAVLALCMAALFFVAFRKA